MKTLPPSPSVAIIATPRVRRRCQAVLRKAGERPVSARRLLRAQRSPVILLDAVASPLRALFTLPAIRHLTPAARVILIGGRPRSADLVREAVRRGACGHVAARHLARDLPRAVRSVRAGQPWLSRRLATVIVTELRGAHRLADQTTRLRLIRDRGERVSDGAGIAGRRPLPRP